MRGEFATTRPTPTREESNRLAAGELVMRKEWDRSPIAVDQSPDPSEPPGRPMAPPINTGPPTVSGGVTVGQFAVVSNGTWANSPTAFSYQWRRNGVNIGGAVAQLYTLTEADAGNFITAIVTARNIGGAGPPRESGNTVGPIAAA
jgi:hypothetical protein